jgi:malate synthase
LEAWLGGNGCVPLYNLMEDAATAEISRTQIWQWLQHGAQLEDGRVLSLDLYKQLLSEEMQVMRHEVGDERFEGGHFELASKLFDDMISSAAFTEFLTLPAYTYLVKQV